MGSGKSRLHASHPLYRSRNLWRLHLVSLMPCRRAIPRISRLVATRTPLTRPKISRISRARPRTSPGMKWGAWMEKMKRIEEHQDLVEQVVNTLSPPAAGLGSTSADLKNLTRPKGDISALLRPNHSLHLRTTASMSETKNQTEETSSSRTEVMCKLCDHFQVPMSEKKSTAFVTMVCYFGWL